MKLKIGLTGTLILLSLAGAAAFEPPTFAAEPKGSQTDVSWERYRQAALEAYNQGHLDAAEDLFRQACKAAARGKRIKPDDLCQCQNGLARVLTLQAKADEATALYKRSLAMLIRDYGPRSPEILDTMLELGSLYESEGDHPEAMSLYNRVLSINESRYGPDHPAVARSLHRLARVKSSLSKEADAESDYKHALAILEKQPKEDGLAAILKDYATLLRKSNRAAEADELEKKAHQHQQSIGAVTAPLAIPAQSYWILHQQLEAGGYWQTQASEEQRVMDRANSAAPTNENLAPIYTTLADVHFKQKRMGAAEPLYKDILSIDERTLGASHPGFAADLTNLAQLYVSQHRYSEAEPLIKRALAIYDGFYGSSNLLVIKTRTLLGSVFEQMGNLAQAEITYKEALELAKRQFRNNDAETADLLNRLAFLYSQEGKLADAESYYKQALASVESAHGAQDPSVAACLRDYAALLRKMNRTEESDKLEIRAAAIR